MTVYCSRSAIRDGVEPPAVLVPDVLLESSPRHLQWVGIGKAFLMLWLILRVLARGAPVIVRPREQSTDGRGAPADVQGGP